MNFYFNNMDCNSQKVALWFSED